MRGWIFPPCKTPLVFGVFSSIVCRLHRGKSNAPNVYVYNRLRPIDRKTNRFVYAVVRAGHEIEAINSSCQTDELICSRSNVKSLNSLRRVRPVPIDFGFSRFSRCCLPPVFSRRPLLVSTTERPVVCSGNLYENRELVSGSNPSRKLENRT